MTTLFARLSLICAVSASFAFGGIAAAPAVEDLDARIDGEIASLLDIYRQLHAAPELSCMEAKTAAFIARQLRDAGFDVTENVGRYQRPGRAPHGVVGVLENSAGPIVLVRTDLDALPIEEKTGLPFASTVRAPNESGEEVPVMHACGHDIHMACFLGTARMLAALRDRWQGTLILVGQPAEEVGAGARALLADGLYERFGRPDFALALHLDPALEAGRIGVCPGGALAGVDSVDITVRGEGGHGAYPHQTRDPVVLACRIVLDLQTIVSREVSPLDPAVVTVGSIHGGTKHNIIPDEVRLQLTVRTCRPAVRTQVLDAIARIARGAAEAAGIPADRAPIVAVDEHESTPALHNDPELAARLAAAWKAALGGGAVAARDPVMAGEDFARYALEGREVPICLFWLGGAGEEELARSRASGDPLPALHSAQLKPAAEPAIRTGVKAMTAAVMELMQP